MSPPHDWDRAEWSQLAGGGGQDGRGAAAVVGRGSRAHPESRRDGFGAPAERPHRICLSRDAGRLRGHWLGSGRGGLPRALGLRGGQPGRAVAPQGGPQGPQVGLPCTSTQPPAPTPGAGLEGPGHRQELGALNPLLPEGALPGAPRRLHPRRSGSHKGNSLLFFHLGELLCFLFFKSRKIGNWAALSTAARPPACHPAENPAAEASVCCRQCKPRAFGGASK